MSSCLSVHIAGLKTESEMNLREHWSKRDRRRREQRNAVYFTWRQTAFGRSLPKLPVVVKLTRFGPRTLDTDNLAASFKAVRDCVADLLKVDDGDERIQFEYAQQLNSDYAVTISVEGK